jgi:hypothetical protein
MRLAAASLLLALAACAHTPPPPDPLAHAASLMTGHFDSREQARTDAGYMPILLSMQPLWEGRDPDARWLYVEQATAESPDKPYRQRVYRLSLSDAGEVVSEVFALDEPERYIRGWETGALAALTQDRLQRRSGCEVYLQPVAGGFRGATRGQACESTLRGARWASAEVDLDAGGLRSWDRGFDTDGRQVWGAIAGPYRFKRREITPGDASG